MLKSLLLMMFMLTSNCDWTGGEITDYGEYCDGEFKISVYEKDNRLKYEVRNRNDELVIQQDMNISVFQRWGLFLDKKKDFWVLSSDVGISVWRKDPDTGQYRKHTFYHRLGKDDVPPELYASSLRRFL
ncbi:hypothetical protein [Dawidia soli]|nr:hypothetical protein [Dawidia soli]